MANYEIKSVDTRGGIDGSVILKGVAEQAKSWVKSNRGTGGNPLERTGLLAKFSAGLARALLGRMVDLEQRLAAVEGTGISKALDVEAYGEMAEMSERLEQMEARLADSEEHGFRYRGYWRDGVSAKRGDAYTHNGSVWWAARNTTEKPCNESFDWQVAVRKGRDAA